MRGLPEALAAGVKATVAVFKYTMPCTSAAPSNTSTDEVGPACACTFKPSLGSVPDMRNTPELERPAPKPMIARYNSCQSESEYGPASPVIVPFQGLESWVIFNP